MPRFRRVAVGIEYDGSDFVGWQRQKDGRSVQEEVEHALTKVAAESIAVVTAGRTDAGVHARLQVAHFECAASRSALNWVLGTNRHLPADVVLHWAKVVPSAFHARFSALARCYRYRIHEGRIRPALERNRCAWVTQRLDIEAMRQGAARLVGEHDFSAFRAAGCQAQTPWREIKRIELWREAGELYLEVEANAFLQHMVRNIAGSLLWVGKGRKQPDWMRDVLTSRDRRRAGPAAPPQGLTLLGVAYPPHFDIPQAPMGGTRTPTSTRPECRVNNPNVGKHLR